MTSKRTEPSRHLLAGKPYTPAASTDLRATFARIRADQQAAQMPNVSPIKRKASK